jgi:DNA-binding NarL/FixJ family response regulator
VVVDDHPVYRDGVADALGDADDIDVVGIAAVGESAVAVVGELWPDVVLMDPRMPGSGGPAATTAIAPGTRRPPSSS